MALNAVLIKFGVYPVLFVLRFGGDVSSGLLINKS